MGIAEAIFGSVCVVCGAAVLIAIIWLMSK